MLTSKNKKYIFYYHVLNDNVLNILDYLIDKNVIVNLEDLINITNNTQFKCSIIADDAHISNELLLKNTRYDNIYFGMIGIHSMLPIKDPSICFKKLPSIHENLQSAFYHSLSGNNSGFINYNNINNPQLRCLNHTWSHLKCIKKNPLKSKQKRFDIKNPRNWHIAIYFNTDEIIDGFLVSESEILNLRSYFDALREIEQMQHFNLNKNFVVAPWNEINSFFCIAAGKLGYKYIIHENIYDIDLRKNIDIPRIDIEYKTLDEIVEAIK